MLDFSNAHTKSLIIHRVGNKLRQEGLVFSKSLVQIDDELVQQLLFQYLINPFRRNDNLNRFSHGTDIRFNEVYMYLSQIFKDPDSFLEQSTNVARHLYESSTHPRIKGSEFYMVYLNNVRYGDVVTDAIGMFRTENKETYLKVLDGATSFNVVCDTGININTLDKGCLVLNVETEDGFRVFVVDAHSKLSSEARYWRDDFLSIIPIQTEDVLTKEYIEMVGHFVSEKIDDSENKIKSAQIRSKAVKFFEDNTTFDAARFEGEVLGDDNEIKTFRDYKEQYQEVNSIDPPPEQFTISQSSVKAVKRRMRSVIKLDQLADIYIRSHDPLQLKNIERGRDSHRNMNYYKIYFKDES